MNSRKFYFILWLAIVCVCASALSAVPSIEEASRLEVAGKFKEAAAVLGEALASPSLDDAQRRTLRFELDRLDRIRKDFPYSKEALFAELKQAVRNLTEEEFEAWIAEGRFDSREIDGVVYYMTSSVSNLFWRHAELNSRRVPPKDTAAVQREHWKVCNTIQQEALSQQTPYVLPKRFEVTMTVTARPGAVPAGETLRAWLPVPRQYPFQTDFELLSANPPVKDIADASSPIRSVYVEQQAPGSEKTTFNILYRYTTHGVRFEVDPDKVREVDPEASPELRPYLAEAPHVEFTPEMRALADRIAGDETNPYLKAKKFHAWIAENIKYSYAIEYSTIRNISEYCRTRGYGDCGQEALLFITLCRLSGIPARWQSGWTTFPNSKSIHDWTEIYVAPYGWMPVDPYMGIYAMRYARDLSVKQRCDIRDFYFGGLDQYRLIANSDHCQELSPPKESFRSDNVDFQRGELEYGDRNVYFDQYSYSLVAREIPLNAKE